MAYQTRDYARIRVLSGVFKVQRTRSMAIIPPVLDNDARASFQSFDLDPKAR